MGDRIAILREGSRIVQYDTPERILTSPADGFVEDFVGAGALLKGLNLLRVRDARLSDWPVAESSADRAKVREAIMRSGKPAALLVDERRRPRRWVTIGDLDRADRLRAEVGLPASALVEPQSSLHDALNEMIDSDQGVAVVVGKDGSYQGVVELETILAAVKLMRRTAGGRHRAEAGVDAPSEEVVS